MEQLAGVVPNDPDDQIERTLEDDSTENSSEYSGHAGYIPPDYSDDTVYQMDVNGVSKRSRFEECF